MNLRLDRFIKCFFALLLLLPLLFAKTAPALDTEVSTFLQTYCIDCHGPKKQKGDFRVDAGICMIGNCF